MANGLAMIWVESLVEIIHQYVAAATEPTLADVKYLAFPHQHFLRVRVSVEVFHADRELELHQFRRWLLGCFPEQPIDFGGRSIESIADELHAKVAARYPGRVVEIEVSEDGIVGTTVRYPAEATAA